MEGGMPLEENAEAREDLILGLAALSGDFPIKLIHLLPGSMDWTRKTIHALAADQLVKRHLKNSIKSLRLTKRGREILTHAFPERFLPIFTDAYLSRCRKSDPASLERIHRAAAVYVLMQQAGVPIYPDEKPALFSAVDAPVPDLQRPCFYTSLEVKARRTDLTRIQATRAAGVLLGRQCDAYLIYNTGSAPLKWSSKAEQKLMGAVKGILLEKHVPLEEVQGLMIGSGMDTALELLRSTGGYRRQNFRLDGTFTAFHYAPCDKEGIRLIRLLCCPPAREALAKRLRGSCEAPRNPRFDCDAVQDGKAVLFAWEFDLEKLRRYKNGLELFGEKGTVYCFDYQADCLSAYLGELARTRPLDAGKTYRELKNYGL